MAFSPDEIRANREYFAAKLRANEQKADVVHWVKKDPGFREIVLLDTRARDAFNKAHIEGAICVPLSDLKELAVQLPRDKTLVTYCWNHH